MSRHQKSSSENSRQLCIINLQV